MEFLLRAWTPGDLPALLKYANNANIAKNLTNGFPHPYSEENGKQFIALATKDTPNHIFAIEVNGEAVGGIGIHPQQDILCKNAELGYWLGEPFWNKGIISRAIPQMLEFAFKTYDITRVFARPFSSNLASQKVLEKSGFKLEARFEKTIYKNGQFLDELIYAYRLK